MIKKLIAAAIVCFALSGCTSGPPPALAQGPAPSPSPSPAPVAIIPARRGQKVWWADWARADIGARRDYDGSTVPPTLSSAAPWLVSNGPGSGGWWAADPLPNAAFTSGGGMLTLNSEVPGWSMISGLTFPKDGYLSLKWLALAAVTDPVPDAFFGIGFYDGEQDYRTINLMRGITPGKLALVLLTEPAHSLDILVPDFCDESTAHTFRFDMDAGVLSLYVDGCEVTLPQYGALKNDPHICIFIGGMYASMTEIDLFSEQP